MARMRTAYRVHSSNILWRLLVVATLVAFVITNTGFAVKLNSVKNVDTVQKGIRIGLANMFAPKITITMNGAYSINVQDLIASEGTSFTLGILEGRLDYEYGNCDELIFTPMNNESTIRLEVGAKKYNYKGKMSFKVKEDKILPVNTIDIESYLKGVVGYEMSNSYPIEALKAQAIAARNYTFISMNKHGKDGYDLCDTTDCQVYKGHNSSYLNVVKAVNDTTGRVLVYNDELVGAYYSASCGGYTEASGNIWSKQLPYLIVKKDDFENESWPYGEITLNSFEMDAKIKKKKYLKATDTFLRIEMNSIKKNQSGRVSFIEISYLDSSGKELKKAITKEGPRTFLELPSSLYNVTYDLETDRYTFKGMGYGHGVGMSQIGAKNRAKAGQTYKDILLFYYDGAKLVDLKADSSNSVITEPAIKVDSDKGTSQNLETPVDTIPESKEELPSPTPTQTPTPTPTLAPTPTANVDSIPPAKNGDKTGKTTTNSAITTSNKTDDHSVVPKPNTGTKVQPKAIVKIENFSFTRELKKGMKGNDVKKLQDILKKLKYLKVSKTTIYFGDVTEKSIKEFQKKHKLKISGVADKATYSKMASTLTALNSKSKIAARVKMK